MARINISKSLGIEKTERQSVLLLALQSLFIGIFNGTFYIGSHTLFIGSYGEKMIPQGYMISGLVGIVLTFIFSKLQNNIKFSLLSKINLLFIALCTLALALSYNYIEADHVNFAQFIMFGPLFILAIVAYWGGANRIYNLRQGKRLFGIIDSGVIFGIIISSVFVPLIPYFLGDFPLEYLLYISTGSIFIATLLQFVITSKFDLNSANKDTSESEEKVGISILFKNKYVFAMASFVGLSVVVAFFVQYSFMSVVSVRYPEETELAGFLGIFTFTLSVFTFIIKAFVYSKLIKNYGLKVSLLILPLILIILTTLAIGLGYILGMDSIEASGFLFFFMLISISKLIAQSLKEGVELPSFKLLYQTLNKKIRHTVQAQIDGTINELSALFSGIALTGLSMLTFIDLIHISIVTLFIIGVWAIVTIRLYKAYVKALQNSMDNANSTSQVNNNILFSERLIHKFNSDKRNGALELKLLKSANPIEFCYLLEELKPGNLNIKEIDFILEEAKENPSFTFLNAVNNIISSSTDKNTIEKAREVAIEINDYLEEFNFDKIVLLSKSIYESERKYAAYALRYFGDKEANSILLRLIKDIHNSVKREAIITCSILNKSEFCSIIIEHLENEELFSSAYASIQNFGEEALQYLEQTYYKTGIDQNILASVTQLISRIDSEKVVDILYDKLSSSNRKIIYEALLGLKAKKFNPNSESQRLELNQFIDNQIESSSWIMAALNTVKQNHGNMEETYHALKQDLSFSFEVLYLFMFTAYDNNSISVVIENLEQGTPESNGFALEMLELIVNDELKPKLFPLIEDSSIAERVKKLEDYYPIEVLRENNIVVSLLNRDNNYISDWTKACALNEYKKYFNELNHSITAHVFSKNVLLKQLAKKLVFELDPNKWEQILLRFNENQRAIVENEFELYKNNESLTLFHKLNTFIKSNSNLDIKAMNWTNNFHFFNDTNYDQHEQKFTLINFKDKKNILKTVYSKEGEIKEADGLLLKGEFLGRIFSDSNFSNQFFKKLNVI